MKKKKLESMLDCVDDNKAALTVLYSALLIVLVGVLGYSLGSSKQSQLAARGAIEAYPFRAQKVLGDRIAPFYVNPFDEIDAKSVAFPIAQLRGCRNWEECGILCSKPANFQQCSAWEKSQK